MTIAQPNRWDLYVGRARDVLEGMPDGRITTTFTSPPYWSQRQYDAGNAKELGHEDTPGEFARALVDELDPLRRKMHKRGKLYLNIGDTMMGSGGAGGDHNRGGSMAATPKYRGSKSHIQAARELEAQARMEGLEIDLVTGHIPPDKGLALVPMRVALGLSDAGWIVRSDIIWSKRNCKPEGVRDRPSRSHEYVFLCSLSPSYDYDYVGQLEPAVEPGRKRNRRSVWNLSTSTFRGAHFATFPPELVEPAVLATTPRICGECYTPHRAIIEQDGMTAYQEAKAAWDAAHPEGPSYTSHLRASASDRDETGVGNVRDNEGRQATMRNPVKRIVGYEHSCPAKLEHRRTASLAAIVFDPFAGAGSTAIAALRHGRSFLGTELSPEFAKLAEERIRAEFPDVPGTLHI